MTKFEIISKEQFEKDFAKFPDVKYEELKLPKRATTGSAGYDFYSPIGFKLKPGATIKIPTGVRILLPRDKFLLMTPRSGLGFKYRLQLDNTVGVIDSDYSNSDNEGHIWIKMTNTSNTDTFCGVFSNGELLELESGDAVAQGIILKYETTDDDDTKGVRNGGFGSTDLQKSKDDKNEQYENHKAV